MSPSLLIQPCDPLQQDMGGLLNEPKRVKDYVKERTDKFVNSPQSPLDGTLHPGLNATRIVGFEAESHGAVSNVAEMEGIEVDLGIKAGEEVDQKMQTLALVQKEPEFENHELIKNSSEAEMEEQRFIQALKDYEETAKDKYKTGVRVDDMHNMDDIWAILDATIEKCKKEDTKGVWGKIRLAFRKLGEHDKAVTGWLGVVPSENDYLSVICGGLKMILKAAARMKEVADEIFEALVQIPTILSGAQRVLVLYKDSTKLQSRSSALYTSVLQGLGYLLSYLREKSVSRSLKNSVKAFVQQSSFGLEIDRNINAITKSRDAFNDEADICQKEMVRKMNDMIETGRNAAQDVQVKMNAMADALETARLEKQRSSKEIGESLEIIKETASQLRQEVAATRSILFRVESLLMASPKVLAEAIMNCRPLDAPVSSHPLQLMMPPENDSRGKIPGSRKSRDREFSKRELKAVILSRINYDEQRAKEDVAANYMIAATLSREEQQRCINVIQSAALGIWVGSAQSVPLVVHGNSAKAQRRSPLSFTCAKLVYTLDVMRSTNPDVFPLHFFCGEHTDHEKWNTPVGVANSLLAQLVDHCKSNNLVELIKLGDFNNNDMKAVCKRFESALANLPKTAIVFCIVDALSFYVDDERMGDEAEALLAWLIRLSRGQYKGSRGKDGCIFKLLLTAPFRLHGRALEELSDDEVITVPRKLPSGGGFNDMKWELSIGSELQSLR